MSRLFLRFHDDSFDGFDWCIVDIEAPVEHLRWQQSAESGLKALLSQYAMPTVLIIPQQSTYLTEFELPEKASRQVLASIEFQIEDQLAQDTELQHYALGEQRDNKVPIVVVQQAVMQSCQSLIHKYGIRAVQIIPELFFCPWFDGEGDVSLIECQNGVILRYGEYQGLQCKLEVLNSMLDLVNRQTPISQVNCFLDDELTIDALNISKYETSAKPLNTTSLDLEKISTINLQQRQFQVSWFFSPTWGASKSASVRSTHAAGHYRSTLCIACRRISSPTVACPAITSRSSKGGTTVIPDSAARSAQRAAAAA